MDVLITGGAGFLGQRLARRLLQRGTLSDASGERQAFSRLVLLDVVEAPDLGDARVVRAIGDLSDPAVLAQIVTADTASIFHLAAVVSGQAEADFDLGMRVNLDASHRLLERCRAVGRRPRVVFTSSVAVYGGDLPAVVQDDTAVNPQSSYGTQKAVAELLLSDYSRRGFVDGRVLRLPTVSVRPGQPNKAASSFASGIIREPLSGKTAVCPVAPETRLWLLSPRKAIECLLRGHDLPSEALGGRRAINMPGLSVSVADMVASLDRVGGAGLSARIRWERDPAIERIVGTWPGAWNVERAHQLGLGGDADFDEIVKGYIEDELGRAP